MAKIVSNEQFLKTFLGADWQKAHVCGFPEDPGTLDNSGKRHFWAGGLAGKLLNRLKDDWNIYVAISVFNPDDTGGARRSKHLHRYTWVIVVDDVGRGPSAKVDPDRLAHLPRPAAKIQTSEGNWQYWYVLEFPETDRARVDALLDGMVASGLCPDGSDPGMKGVTRYVRLPVSRNTKGRYGPDGWTVRLDEFNPLARVTLDELADAFDVVVDPDLIPRERTVTAVTLAPGARDVWLEAQHELGLVKGQLRPGVWEVVCPFVDEHTGRADTGTAYFGGAGAWKCHHGHCQDRQAPDFQRRIREMLPPAALPAMDGLEVVEPDDVEVEALAAAVRERAGGARGAGGGGGAGSAAVQEFLGDVVFVSGADKFWSERSGTLLKRTALNTLWVGKLRAAGVLAPRQTPAGWFAEHPAALMVSSRIYWPGQDRIVSRPTGAGGGRGLALNTWRPGRAGEIGDGHVRARDVKPWLDLVSDVFNGDRRLIWAWLRWSAGVVFHPGLKPGWGWVIQGAQGIGKDLMMRPMCTGLGVENWTLLGPEKLTSRFTSWLENRLIRVPELKQTTRGASTGHDQYNTLKAYMGSTPEWLQVECKGLDPYMVPNLGAWVFTSNEDVPLPLAEDDRRFAVVASEAVRKGDRYYAGLVRWLDRGGEDKVLGFLKRLARGMNEDGFRGNAPDSEAKRRLIAAGRDPVEVFIRDRVEDGDWSEVMPLEDMLGRLGHAVKSGAWGLGGVVVPTARRLGLILRRLGAVQVADGMKVTLRDGARRRLWVLSGDRGLAADPDRAERVYASEQKVRAENVITFPARAASGG